MTQTSDLQGAAWLPVAALVRKAHLAFRRKLPDNPFLFMLIFFFTISMTKPARFVIIDKDYYITLLRGFPWLYGRRRSGCP